MNPASIVCWAVAAPILPVFGVFLSETLLGLARAPARRNGTAKSVDTVALMPAHNEGAGIARTIAAFHSVAPEGMRLLVVADNCSDRTAAVAREAGAEVAERNDPERRGKGYALAFGRDHLRASPPECVIVLDADCVAAPDTLGTLANEAVSANRPAQANYLMESRGETPPLVEISNFAFLVKNLIRQRGAARIGAPALLTGTGMAFPWPVFAEASLASGDIVEDLALGIELTRKDRAPRFIEQARVTSEAASARDTITQRTRWEHGFVKTARTHGLPLIGEGIVEGRWPLFWMGLHLLVPPLALLFALGLALAAALLLAGWLTDAGYGPAFAVSAMLGLSGAAVFLAWLREGRAVLGFATLLRVPLYILWKIPVYLRLVRGAETQWVRTNRKGE